MSHHALSGISPQHLAELVAELVPAWEAQQESALRERRGGDRRPGVKVHVDEGYRGLANQFPRQVTAPPRKPKKDAPLGEQHAWRHERRAQSSNRICVEHANAEYKQWRSATPAAANISPRPKPP
ncbi:hypothetical protein ACFV6D_13965 [Kitasatospora sp. NPDC059812]|uniref:hypothetical protein n=1 Tax=Kitasatospora sp. NPDC059812 TaxID=3346958 RepID=UPI0036550117